MSHEWIAGLSSGFTIGFLVARGLYRWLYYDDARWARQRRSMSLGAPRLCGCTEHREIPRNNDGIVIDGVCHMERGGCLPVQFPAMGDSPL